VADLTVSALAGAAGTLAPWLHDLLGLWETFLQVGGFPRSVASYLTVRQEDATLLRSLLDVIHGDAFRASEWSRTQTTAFLRRLTKGLGSPANHTAIAEELGTSASTVSRRIANLQEAFVVWPAHQEHRLRPNLKAQAKLYFTDPIYTRLTAGIVSEPHLDLTALSEQQLGMALVRNLERQQPGSYMEFDSVLYHRTATRKEIDFVGPDFGGMAIESKYIDGRWRGVAQTLAASRWRGVIATRTQIEIEDDLAAVPAPLLAYLIDV
jgi:predicted AAA+ superfamily ATPase